MFKIAGQGNEIVVANDAETAVQGVPVDSAAEIVENNASEKEKNGRAPGSKGWLIAENASFVHWCTQLKISTSEGESHKCWEQLVVAVQPDESRRRGAKAAAEHMKAII